MISHGAPIYGAAKQKRTSAQTLYELSNKQIESESIIQRMSVMVNKLYDESNAKDNRILELEQQIQNLLSQISAVQHNLHQAPAVAFASNNKALTNSDMKVDIENDAKSSTEKAGGDEDDLTDDND